MTLCNPKRLVYLFFLLGSLLGYPTWSAAITINEEAELAEEFLRLVDRHYQKVQDPVIADYVDRVGQRLLKKIEPQPFDYHFWVIHDKTLNAFAGPGGNLFVTTGMLSVMTDESDLAGLLAHEIAHGVCRHISEGMARNKQFGWVTLAGLLASALVGSQVSAEAAQALAVTSLAAGQSLALAYSRENETQADQLGLQYLSRAGYTSAGLQRVLRKILDQRWYTPDLIPTYLSTHPGLEDRMASIETLRHAYEKDRAIASASKAPVGDFGRIHTRVRVQYGDAAANQTHFARVLANDPDNPDANYGYGLMLAKQGQRAAAMGVLRRVLERRPFDDGLLADLGRVYFRDGNYAQAKSFLKSTLEMDADNMEGLYYLGRIHLSEGRPNEAVRLFAPLAERRVTFARIDYFISQAYGALKDTGRAHYHQGLFQKQQNNLRAAKFHFQKALEASPGLLIKNNSEAALKEIRVLQKKDAEKEANTKRR